MTTYPLVRFTDEPSSSAAVRFDFKGSGVHGDDEAVVERDGFSFGSPSFEGDPDGIGVEYGLRELSLSLTVYGSHAAASRVLSRLGREIQRANWLMYQHDVDSSPVWFKTYPSAPGALSFEQMHIDKWQVEVSLSADPFAYGERVTLPTVTIANDPAAGTNPVSYTLPAILGDAPAPLRVKVEPFGAGATVLAFLSSGEHSQPVVTSDGLLSPGVDAAQVAEVTASEGSAIRVDFATDTTLVSRAVWAEPLYAGRYKALARVRATGGTVSAEVQAHADAVLVDLTAGVWRWVDLGNVASPVGNPYAPGFQEFAEVAVSIKASRTAGTGSLDIDTLLLLPVDVVGSVGASTLRATFGNPAAGNPAAAYAVINGEADMIHVATAADQLKAMDAGPMLVGAFPVAWPGEKNTLTWLPRYLTSSGDDITATTDLTISYHPRYLYLGAD